MIFRTLRLPSRRANSRIKFAVEPWERSRRGGAAPRGLLRRAGGCSTATTATRSTSVAIPLVAVSFVGVAADAVVGTVRIHEAEAGLWWGSRLAVAQDCRGVGALGAGLVRLAVASAHARGCRRFLAHVQAQNALLFTRLHWRTLEQRELHGRPHHLMEADLDFYPPFAAPETGFVALRKAA